MFHTYTGVFQNDDSKVYLRPETAQGIFLEYKNILDTSRVKPPFGMAQVGKAFRNEVTPRNFIFRTREFEQMEMEFFCPPEDGMMWYEFWVDERLRWWEAQGVTKENLFRHVIGDAERAFYSAATSDIEYLYPFTAPNFGELEGVAYRTDYDLKQHQTHSKVNLEYIDQENGNRRYIPHVVEPASGLDARRAGAAVRGLSLRRKPRLAGMAETETEPCADQARHFPAGEQGRHAGNRGETLSRSAPRSTPCQYDAKQSSANATRAWTKPARPSASPSTAKR